MKNKVTQQTQTKQLLKGWKEEKLGDICILTSPVNNK